MISSVTHNMKLAVDWIHTIEVFHPTFSQDWQAGFLFETPPPPHEAYPIFSLDNGLQNDPSRSGGGDSREVRVGGRRTT